MDSREALIDWDEPNDAGSNTAHGAEHRLTPEEVESALYDEKDDVRSERFVRPAHRVLQHVYGPIYCRRV